MLYRQKANYARTHAHTQNLHSDVVETECLTNHNELRSRKEVWDLSSVFAVECC